MNLILWRHAEAEDQASSDLARQIIAGAPADVFFSADTAQMGLVVRQGPYSPDFLEMAGAGWESSFTKLDELLAG